MKIPKRKKTAAVLNDLRRYFEAQDHQVFNIDLNASRDVQPIQSSDGREVGYNAGPQRFEWKIYTMPKAKSPTKKELAKRAAAQRRADRERKKLQMLHDADKCGGKDKCDICFNDYVDSMGDDS